MDTFYYNRVAWDRRRRNQLLTNPLCKFCLVEGRSELARVADHVVPHRGNVNLFFLGELQSLCIPCHNRVKQGDENRGYSLNIGSDGWPTDPNHPTYAVHDWKPNKRKVMSSTQPEGEGGAGSRFPQGRGEGQKKGTRRGGQRPRQTKVAKV
jgi:5-methylcytosine-specific restriction enzyme A